MSVDFATFCYAGDAHRLHAPGQLRRQVESNNYPFNQVIIIYQNCKPHEFGDVDAIITSVNKITFPDIDSVLRDWGIDLNKPQYISSTDKAHIWKNHVVNHLVAAEATNADYIVFADNDCWMVRQPKTFGGFALDDGVTVFKDGEALSWISRGIEILENDPEAFIVSPNDGEPERKTWRMSQQMFLARVNEFRNADFNQPGWDGNVNIPGGPMPEYWAMLEGRMELYCRTTGQYRCVLGGEYRYWHHNKLTKDDLFETDISKY